jgi:hypothetical protein
VDRLVFACSPACTTPSGSGENIQGRSETAQVTQELGEQPEEFPETDLVQASWSTGPNGTVKLKLVNTGSAATVEIGGTLVGPGINRTVIAGVETLQLGAGSTATINLSKARLLRTIATGAPDGTLVQFYVRSVFTNGYAESDYSDVAAVAGKNLDLLANGDARRVWSRSPPVFDAELLRVAKENDPAAFASAQEMMATTAAPSGGGSVSPSSIVSKKLCFQQLTTYQQGEANVGEDIWAESTGAYRAHSAGWIYIDSGTTWSGYLDIFGCTPQLSLSTGYHTTQIVSSGRIGASYIRIGDYDTTNPDCQGCHVYQQQNWTIQVDASTVQQVYYVPDGANYSKLNVYPAASFAIFQNNGNAYEYRIQVRNPASGSATDTFATYAQIRLAFGHQDNKINITHELGHAFWRGGGGPPMTGISNLDYTGSNSPCVGNVGGHWFTEIEWVGGALSEAFGNFYGAATWNYPTVGADCRYSDPNNGNNGLDCAGEGSGASYIQYRYM